MNRKRKSLGMGLAIAAAAIGLVTQQAGAAPAVETFGSLSLDRAQSRALNASPDVRIARAKVAEDRALYDQARLAYGPALTANYAQAPQGSAEGTQTQRLTTVGAQVLLGDLLAYSPVVAQASANLRAAEFDLANAERAERIAVTGMYFAALSANATQGAREEALAGARSLLRSATLRYQAGDVPHLDVVRALVGIAQAQAALATAQANRQNAYALLQTEIGSNGAALRALAPMTSSGAPVTASVDGAVRTALARRPEVASAEESVNAEERAVQVARRGTLPVLLVSGGYTQGVDSGFHVAGPSANAQLTFPLGGATRARIAAEQARLDEARATLDRVRRAVANEVSAAVRNDTAQTQSLAAAGRALQAATAELRATELGYRSGASSSLDVVTARTTYVQALVDDIAATYARAQAEATLRLLTEP